LGSLVNLLLSKREQKMIKYQRKATVLEECESESESFSDFELTIEKLREIEKLGNFRESQNKNDLHIMRL